VSYPRSVTTATLPKIGDIVGVRFAGHVERAVVVEDRGVLRGHHIYRVRVGDWDDLDAPELELPLEDLADVRWLVASGPEDVTEKGRDGRVFRYTLTRPAGEPQREVSVLTTGTYLALARQKNPEVRDAARTAGRAAVDARLTWLEPPRRIVVSSADVAVELPDQLRPELRAALRSLEREGWEVHVRDDVPSGLRLDGELVSGRYWALLARGDSRHDVTGYEDPNAAAAAVLGLAGIDAR